MSTRICCLRWVLQQTADCLPMWIIYDLFRVHYLLAMTSTCVVDKSDRPGHWPATALTPATSARHYSTSLILFLFLLLDHPQLSIHFFCLPPLLALRRGCLSVRQLLLPLPGCCWPLTFSVCAAASVAEVSSVQFSSVFIWACARAVAHLSSNAPVHHYH